MRQGRIGPYHSFVRDGLNKAIDDFCKRLCRQLGSSRDGRVPPHTIFPSNTGLFHGGHSELRTTPVLHILLGAERYFAHQRRELLIYL